MRYLSPVLSVVAIILAVWAIVKVNSPGNSRAATGSEETDTIPVKKIEVADYMNKVQLYANKAYFAGKGENKALFNFYLTEINEAMSKVAEAEVMDKEVNVSDNMKAFGLQSVKVLQKRIEEEGFKNFEEHYQNMVSSCNSCHKICLRPFVVITKPEKPVFDNQDYKKGPYSDSEVDMDGD